MFSEYEVPVAYSMVKLLRNQQTHEPLQEFMLNWLAFNNIYTTLADSVGDSRKLKQSKNGTLQTRSVGNVTMPKVEVPTERKQIDVAFCFFKKELKRGLVMHQNTDFFVYRSPKWCGQTIEFDVQGQRLNGVLNVGHTISNQHPIWSPIDTKQYERYVQDNDEDEDDLESALAKQILDLLYTVRNNTFHGGKRADDSNDQEVLLKATPLLSLIVAAFLVDSTS